MTLSEEIAVPIGLPMSHLRIADSDFRGEGYDVLALTRWDLVRLFFGGMLKISSTFVHAGARARSVEDIKSEYAPCP